MWGRREVYAGFWWGNLRGRYHLEDPGIGERMILKWDGGLLAGLIWLRIWTGGRHL
jgi:hypothetical protein